MTAELARLDQGRVLAQYGPMRLVITAESEHGPDDRLAEEAGRWSFGLLPRLAEAPNLFRRPGVRFTPDFDEPLLNQMVAAVNATGVPDLGPMAAVAGVVAEAVAQYLRDAGATTAIVDNGGDLAIYLAPGRVAMVGVRRGVKEPEPTYALTLDGDRRSFWGVCSSGFGGRSLTRGVADTALCVAGSTPVADAAATALGNACDVDSPKIRRAPAEVLRPETDIPGLTVTASVGPLTAEETARALRNALSFGQRLVHEKIILGALVALNDQMFISRSFADLVAPLTPL
jgi:ApbE superfamily uncharacterized protein (UPF0280 family)